MVSSYYATLTITNKNTGTELVSDHLIPYLPGDTKFSTVVETAKKILQENGVTGKITVPKSTLTTAWPVRREFCGIASRDEVEGEAKWMGRGPIIAVPTIPQGPEDDEQWKLMIIKKSEKIHKPEEMLRESERRAVKMNETHAFLGVKLECDIGKPELPMDAVVDTVTMDCGNKKIMFRLPNSHAAQAAKYKDDKIIELSSNKILDLVKTVQC
ncbi:MAG: hypothetical protein SGARI_005298 [Bacillariaceae sp.]